MIKLNKVAISQDSQRHVLFYSESFFDNLHLQIIASISPKASVQNSSAQWAIFFITLTHYIFV